MSQADFPEHSNRMLLPLPLRAIAKQIWNIFKNGEPHNHFGRYENEIVVLSHCPFPADAVCLAFFSTPVFVYARTSQCKLLIVSSWGRAIRASCCLRLTVTGFFPCLVGLLFFFPFSLSPSPFPRRYNSHVGGLSDEWSNGWQLLFIIAVNFVFKCFFISCCGDNRIDTDKDPWPQ